MNPAPPVNAWRTRRLVTLLVLLSFLAVLFTGVACYLKPQGKVANRTGWTWLSLSKADWEETHTTTSVLLLLASAVHIWFNRRPLLHYLRGVYSRLRGGRWEFLLALLLLGLVWVGTLRRWEPFVSLARWNQEIKIWWADAAGLSDSGRGGGGMGGGGQGRSGGGGYGRLDLAGLCRREGLELGAVQRCLDAAGLPAAGNTGIRELATALGVRPREVVREIRRLVPPGAGASSR